MYSLCDTALALNVNASKRHNRINRLHHAPEQSVFQNLDL